MSVRLAVAASCIMMLVVGCDGRNGSNSGEPKVEKTEVRSYRVVGTDGGSTDGGATAPIDASQDGGAFRIEWDAVSTTRPHNVRIFVSRDDRYDEDDREVLSRNCDQDVGDCTGTSNAFPCIFGPDAKMTCADGATGDRTDLTSYFEEAPGLPGPYYLVLRACDGFFVDCVDRAVPVQFTAPSAAAAPASTELRAFRVVGTDGSSTDWGGPTPVNTSQNGGNFRIEWDAMAHTQPVNIRIVVSRDDRYDDLSDALVMQRSCSQLSGDQCEGWEHSIPCTLGTDAKVTCTFPIGPPLQADLSSYFAQPPGLPGPYFLVMRACDAAFVDCVDGAVPVQFRADGWAPVPTSTELRAFRVVGTDGSSTDWGGPVPIDREQNGGAFRIEWDAATPRMPYSVVATISRDDVGSIDDALLLRADCGDAGHPACVGGANRVSCHLDSGNRMICGGPPTIMNEQWADLAPFFSEAPGLPGPYFMVLRVCDGIEMDCISRAVPLQVR